jgi:hypothetical protein
MLIGLWDAAVDVDAEGALLLLLLLLQAASASPAAITALRRRHRRVAGIDGTAKLLCALSQGCGLAVVPVSRVAARLTGFHVDRLFSGTSTPGENGRVLPSYEPPL